MLSSPKRVTPKHKLQMRNRRIQKMSEYKLKTGKIGDAVVGAYKKVEDAFVDAFLEKSEDGKIMAV